MEPVALFTTNTQVEAIECGSEPKPVVAIASSRLEGNRWDSEILFIDEATHKVESVINGQWGGTADVAFGGANCEILTCAADDGKIYTISYHAASGSWGLDENLVLSGHDDVVSCIAASAQSSNVLGSGSWDNRVKLWDLSNPTHCLQTLTGHSDHVLALAWNPHQENQLLTTSQDRSVRLWDSRNDNSHCRVLLAASAMCIDVHPTNATQFSVGLEGGRVLTFDTRRADGPVNSTQAHKGTVAALKYKVGANAGVLLASGGDDTFVSLLAEDPSTSQLREIKRWSAHEDYVRAICFPLAASKPNNNSGSDGGNYVYTGGWDGSAKIWSC